MSVDRKLWNATLSALLLAGTACGTAAGRQSPQGERTPIATPSKTAESTETIFEQANCARGEITIPKPLGWTFLEVSISPNFTNCYVSKQPITREEDFRNGLRVSRLAVPLSEKDKIDYARQLASQPDGFGLLPQANTFSETRIGASRIFSGKFTGNRNNVFVDEEREIIVPDGSNTIYILAFTAPKSTSNDDFRKYGRQMLDGVGVRVARNIF